jgi:L-fuconolactonase
VFAAWKADMGELARCPNVVVKLGGLGMDLGVFDHMRRPAPPTSREIADAWGPWIKTCIETFGAERCMFESNFPVDKLSTGYAVLWNAFKLMAAGASAAEKSALFSGTARKVYRLA